MALNSVFKVYDTFDRVVLVCHINLNNEEVGALVNMNTRSNNHLTRELMHVFYYVFCVPFHKKACR